MPTKNRVVFDLNAEASKNLELIKTSTGISSNKDLVRYSLGLMSLLVKHKQDGYDVLLKKDEDVANIVMPFLGM